MTMRWGCSESASRFAALSVARLTPQPAQTSESFRILLAALSLVVAAGLAFAVGLFALHTYHSHRSIAEVSRLYSKSTDGAPGARI